MDKAYVCLPCREQRHFSCISTALPDLTNPCVCNHKPRKKSRTRKNQGSKLMRYTWCPSCKCKVFGDGAIHGYCGSKLQKLESVR